MKFLDFLYDVVALYVGSDFFGFWFPFLISLFFLAMVPRMIRMISVWR